MAVDLRLSAPNVPARMAPASIVLVGTPEQATGNWAGKARMHALYGQRATAPTIPQLPARYTVTPPHTTAGHSRAVPAVHPAYCVVPPSVPRHLPSAGWRVTGLADGTTVPIIGARSVASSLRPSPRVGAAAARTTPARKPRIRWKTQGR